MNKIPKESIEPSRVMSSSANLYYRTTLKQKLSYQKKKYLNLALILLI